MEKNHFTAYTSWLKSINARKYASLAICLSLILCWGCQKEADPPGVTTSPISDITPYSAKGGGKVISANNGTIAARGLVWDLNDNPIVGKCAGSTNEGGGLGTFTCSLTDLSPGTTYHVRAYATNEAGPGYGEELTFTTPAVGASLTTAPVSNITSNSARSGGSITDAGGAPITERGICWSESKEPTTSNQKTVCGSGTGDFTCELIGMKRYTVYYLRAYATNSAGTSYGNELNFRTEAETPKLSTASIGSVTINSAKSGGSITDDGGAPIKYRGVCWSTSPNPTTSKSKTEDGTGGGTFTSMLSGLSMGSLYYVRAYATNDGGKTGYGSNEVAFLTLLKDVEGNTYKVVRIGDQIWMAENLRTTKYRSGVSVPNVKGELNPEAPIVGPDSDWPFLTSAAWCSYENNGVISATYGHLYNWYAIADARGLCPAGWHVPGDGEWTVLINELGGSELAGGKMKATGTLEAGTGLWRAPNTSATNSSGFSALPGGECEYGYGLFFLLTRYGKWWSSTSNSNEYSSYISLYYLEGGVERSSHGDKNYGFSVRCIRD
jgi:uncharacterized protein (TIGR02145 family)